MKKALLVLLGLFIVGAVVGGRAPDAASTKAASPQDAVAVAKTLGKWDCNESKDNMRRTSINICTAQSANVANFEFPYNKPNNRLILAVRKGVEGNSREAMIQIVAGQISADISDNFQSDDGFISVKAGDSPIKTFRVEHPTNGRHDLAFIQNPTALIALIEKGGPVVVEANFYLHSRQQFTFDLSPIPKTQS